MSEEKIELTPGQLTRIENASEVTRMQVDAAVKIAEEKFSSYQVENKMLFLAAIIQAQATNYLAEVNRSK